MQWYAMGSTSVPSVSSWVVAASRRVYRGGKRKRRGRPVVRHGDRREGCRCAVGLAMAGVPGAPRYFMAKQVISRYAVGMPWHSGWCYSSPYHGVFCRITTISATAMPRLAVTVSNNVLLHFWFLHLFFWYLYFLYRFCSSRFFFVLCCVFVSSAHSIPPIDSWCRSVASSVGYPTETFYISFDKKENKSNRTIFGISRIVLITR